MVIDVEWNELIWVEGSFADLDYRWFSGGVTRSV